MPYKYSILIFILVLGSGCAKNVDGTWKAPFVYRVDIQQGNVVDQAMINKLKPGMDKNQVRYIMGTPLLIDPFHTNRWEYIYSFEPGDGEREQRRITLFFKDEKLAYLDGDIEITHIPINPEEETREKTVVVPIEEHKEGFFSRMMDKVTPGDNESDKKLSEPAGETAKGTTEPVKETGKEPDESAGEIADESSTPVAGDETALLNESPEPEPEDDTQQTSGQQTAVEEAPETAETETSATKQEKSLFRRFWDKITTDDEETKSEEEGAAESEQDAEIFKEAGGGF
ncbi:MAG: outer membrane protein assembly factor BamE [Gammaproteobacteria bacterium]|nr:outer membrane protein assembly factor BamE [Gammaproteobacteria bacterium]